MNSPVKIAASMMLAGVLAGCGGGSSLPASPAGQAATQQAVAQRSGAAQSVSLDLWHRGLVRSELPGSGCFHASYPSMSWTQVSCSTPPHLLYPVPPSRAIRAQSVGITDSVGNGADYSADTGSNKMSEAIGSFPVVTGVTSVKSVENPEFGGGGENGTNSYTLQLNSYFFTSAACGSQTGCEGWEQFVYENPPTKDGDGQLFIQDWLIPTGSKSVKCPSGKGWESADGGCVQNSPNSINIPNIAIKNLGELVETGEAASSGDSIYLAVGTDVYGMKNVQGDGITDLSTNWEGAEFNVIGNAGGDIADFNAGSTIEVGLETNDGVTTAPTCPANSGTTGESNNLSFKAAPSNPAELGYPSILFTMSNVSGGGTASCDSIKGN